MQEMAWFVLKSTCVQSEAEALAQACRSSTAASDTGLAGRKEGSSAEAMTASSESSRGIFGDGQDAKFMKQTEPFDAMGRMSSVSIIPHEKTSPGM